MTWLRSESQSACVSHASVDLSQSTRPRQKLLATRTARYTLHAMRRGADSGCGVPRGRAGRDAHYANAAMCCAAVCRTSTYSVSYSQTRASVWMGGFSLSQAIGGTSSGRYMFARAV